MSPLSKFLRAAMTLALALAIGPRLADAQKALVYCPVSIDATGCATVKTALTTAYPGGIDTGFDGTQGTVDLKTVDLFQYSVVVVPSLADDSTAPYALLRDATVASKLKAALLGRRAFWSGTPDQGVVSTTRPQKDALIQNLAAWAGGDFATVNAPGLVVLQDNSTDVTKRYDWVQAIAGFALVADTKLASYSAVSSLTSAGNAVLTSNGSTLAYTNMASMGFQTPSGAVGTSLDAVGKTGTGVGGQVVLITQSGANTGGAVVTTDKDDYAPGTPVVITGSGFGAGEAVTLLLHEDPTIEPDFSFTATADQNGGFVFNGFTPDTLDVDVRFVLTATGQTSGRRAQTTFTDGGFVVKTSTGATITASTLIYPTSANSCPATAPTGTTTGTLNVTSGGVNFVIPNNNQYAKIIIPLQSNEGGAYSSATAASGGASIISNTPVGSTREICIQSSNGSNTNLGTLTLTYAAAAVATTTAVTSSNDPSAFGQSVTFTATVSRTSGPGAAPTGKIQFKIDGTNFGSQVNLSGGLVSSSSISTLSVGTHTVSADYTPDSPFSQSAGNFTQHVGQSSQTIAFGTISKKTFGDADFGISATASSQLPVSFAATGNCTVSGNQVSITAAGSCTITASQAGNASYAPATPVQQSFTIDPATATLAIDPTSLSATYNGNPHAAIVTTTPTGLTVVGVTYAGNATAPTNAGSYAVVAKLTNANYSATDATGTLTIAKATPSFTTVSISPITYQAPTATISGTVTAGTLVPTGSVGITVSGTGGSIMGSATVDASGNFTTTVTTATLPANPAGYDVALDLPASQNFAQATDNTHKLIVNKAAQSINFTALSSKTYGDAPFAVSATSSSGLAVAFTTSGDCSATSSTITLTGAGSCTVHADQAGDGNYQPALQVSHTFAIDKATAVVSVTGFSGPYDGGPHGATGTATGVGGADLKASLNLGQSFTNVPGGTASWTFTGGQNYKDDQGTVPITITPRAISIAADPQTKVYGDADPALTYKPTSGSLISGDNFSGTLTRVAGENVGTYAIQQGSVTAGNNYTITYTGANLAITTRAISVTADPQTKVYGDPDPTPFTYKVTSGSLAFSDAFTGALAGDGNQGVGMHPIGQGTLALSSNYVLTYIGANLDITPRPITVTADGQTKVYGDNDPAFTAKVTTGNLVFSDGLSGALTRVAGENVGSYAINQGALTAGPNYTVTFVSGSLSITTRPIGITADVKTKVYGDPDPALTYQITSGSLAFTDKFTGSLDRAAGENVGNYAIQQGTVALNANYALTYAGANLSVTARPVAVTADAATKVYGDPDPSPFTYKITTGNLVNGDGFSGALARDPGTNVGSYDIVQGTLALSTNYALTYNKGSLSITPRPIGITADAQTKVYGDADPALTYKTTSGNLVSGDAFTGALTRATGEDVGPYGILQGTVTAGANYALSYTGANLTITTRPVTVTADAQSKVYGDAEPALTYKITAGNLIGTDAFSGALSTVTGAAATVGPHPIDQNTLKLSTNYALTYAGASLTVSARPITVTADAQTKTYGDPDPALTYKITSGNLVYGDMLSGALSRAAGQTVGSYAIQQGNLAATTNYALTYAGASLAITPRSITLKPLAPDLIWNGAPQTPSYSLAIAGGSLATGDMLTMFTGAIYSPMSVTLVGTYTPTLSGAANGNYAVSYATGSFKVLDKTAPTGSIISLDPVGLGVSPKLVVNFTDVATGNSNIIAWKYSLDGVDQPTLSGSGTPSNTFTQQLPAFNTTDVVKVCASAEDAGTNWSAPVCALLAIYDPTAGFVTGGGWINSPIGAYVANPSLTGKANFGFVSKYQKGANVPTGNTEFQFNEANLNFSSTNFQWLVIQGGTSAQFKGTGTINGKGSYNFMVTVVDGDAYNGTKKPDSFRMKITDLSGAVVYDNQIGQPDTSLTPTQSTYLGGGSVVIHDK